MPEGGAATGACQESTVFSKAAEGIEVAMISLAGSKLHQPGGISVIEKLRIFEDELPDSARSVSLITIANYRPLWGTDHRRLLRCSLRKLNV
jgi:hypothetical protein